MPPSHKNGAHTTLLRRNKNFVNFILRLVWGTSFKEKYEIQPTKKQNLGFLSEGRRHNTLKVVQNVKMAMKLILLVRQEIRELKLVQMTPSP